MATRSSARRKRPLKQDDEITELNIEDRININPHSELKIVLQAAKTPKKSPKNSKSKKSKLNDKALEPILVKTPRMPNGPETINAELIISPALNRLVRDEQYFNKHPRRDEISDILTTNDTRAIYNYNIKNTQLKLDQMLQRIRRKIVYIVSYRKHQLENDWVSTDGVFNKYITMHPDRPLYSCKSMLKLIRWCRYFEREYKPIDSRLIDRKISTKKILEATKSELQTKKLKKCFICHVSNASEPCELDSGILYCQSCLFRKYLFLRGANLVCYNCESNLTKDNFERWSNKNWCKRCLTSHCYESKLIFHF